MNRLITYLTDNDGATLYEIYTSLRIQYIIDINRVLDLIEKAERDGIIYTSTKDSDNFLRYNLTK